jgi:hypothetical protein
MRLLETANPGRIFGNPSRFARLGALSLALTLSGCLFQTSEKDGRVAGGAEDFPNTLALGAAVSGHISDNADWDQFSVIPSALPSFNDAESLVVAPETLVAAKIAAVAKASAPTADYATYRSTADTVTWDLSDTATLRIARRFHVQDGLLKVSRDTIVFRYDEKAKDGIDGNELILLSKGSVYWKISGRMEAYRYDNLDSAGGFDRATFFDHIPAAGGSFKNHLLVMLPGPDGDIATQGDNRPAYYAFAIVKPAAAGAPPDTTESFEITDADGDGALWGAGDSGLVDFKQKTPNPVLRPAVDLVVQKMRAFLFKDEQKTYPISFTEVRTEKDGKKVTFSVKGTYADSVFEPGDTAVISVHVSYPPESRLVEKHSRYRVVLGGQPKRYQDNKLIRYTLSATWRKDSLAVTQLTFTPDQPVATGELATAGDLQVDADFSDGETGSGHGRFQDKRIDIDLTRKLRDGKERHYHVLWDALGKLLSQIRLD